MQQVFSNVVQGNPNNAVESTVAQLLGLDLAAGQLIRFEAAIDLTPGASTTAVTLRVRRAIPGGTAIVGAAAVANMVAAVRDIRQFSWGIPAPQEAAGDNYTLTIQQTAGTAAGVLNMVLFGASF